MGVTQSCVIPAAVLRAVGPGAQHPCTTLVPAQTQMSRRERRCRAEGASHTLSVTSYALRRDLTNSFHLRAHLRSSRLVTDVFNVVFSAPASLISCHSAEWHRPALQGPGPEGRSTAAPCPAQLCQAEACPQHDSSITTGKDCGIAQTLNTIRTLLPGGSVCPARPLLCPSVAGCPALAQGWKARGDMGECFSDRCDHLCHPRLDECAYRWFSWLRSATSCC